MKITLRNLVVTKRIGWNMFMIISGCALTSKQLETTGYAVLMKADRQAWPAGSLPHLWLHFQAASWLDSIKEFYVYSTCKLRLLKTRST